MRYFLALLSLSYLGASLCIWGLSRMVPWFLLPDFPFLSIVFAGLFVSGPVGFLCALLPALIREITTSALPGRCSSGRWPSTSRRGRSAAASSCATSRPF